MLMGKIASSGGLRLSDNGKGSSRVKLAIKCIVTAALLWLAFHSVDLAAVSNMLAGLNPIWGVCALLLTSLIVLSDAFLLSSLVHMFGRRMSVASAFVYSIVGWFFSNVAPSTIGGDVFRGVQLSRVGLPVGSAVRVILSMRILTFVTLVAVMIAGSPVALRLAANDRDKVILVGILLAGIGAIAGLFLVTGAARLMRLERWSIGRKMLTLADDFRSLLVPSPRMLGMWLAALSQHLVRVVVFAALATGLGLPVPVATLFAFVPVALLTAMVPISFAGWGVRELSFVYFLGTAGVSAEAALSLSLAYGLLRVVFGAIGGITWVVLHDGHYRVDAPSA
jgi:uncharacterized membrane protein YbhN (UPF0104 family)